MGCGLSVEEKEGRQRNEEIENQLRKDRMSQRNEIKMLLLGMPSPSRLASRECLTMFRCWRVRQIHHPQTNETHSRGQLFKR